MIPASKQHKRTKPLSIIVIHSTESDKASGTISWFENPKNPTAAHYVVAQDGTQHTLCSVNQVLAHCKGYNEISCGIEMVGHASQSSWPDAQVSTVSFICAQILYALGLPASADTIRMHSQCGPDGHSLTGHTDPGAGFPYDKFIQDTAELLASMVAS